MANVEGNDNSANRARGEVEIKNLLIDLVRENPLIYDKSHPDHFRANMRNEVWHNISAILCIPGEYRSIYFLLNIISIRNTHCFASAETKAAYCCRSSLCQEMEGPG